MKKFIVFLFVLMLFIMSYKDKKFETVKKDSVISEVKPIVKKVDIIYNDEVKNIDLEDYVVGVVACEMPASFDIEASSCHNFSNTFLSIMIRIFMDCTPFQWWVHIPSKARL